MYICMHQQLETQPLVKMKNTHPESYSNVNSARASEKVESIIEMFDKETTYFSVLMH